MTLNDLFYNKLLLLVPDMMNKYFLLILGFFWLCIQCHTPRLSKSSFKTISGSDLNAIGRFDKTASNELEMISSGAHFDLEFYGKECRIKVALKDKNAHNYLQYELDGQYIKRLKIIGAVDSIYKIQINSEGKHRLKIFKATEAHTGPIFIQSVSGENIKSISISDLHIIEFIGNSITCGAAADPSEIGCGKGVYHDQHNAYMAYGPRLTRTLNAEFILSSVSGYGIYRTWNKNGPDMTEVYNNTDFQLNSSRKWNFDQFKPKIISIALGTNDLSTGDGITPRPAFSSDTFKAHYIRFIHSIKKLNPTAQIVLLSSPLLNGDRSVLLQNLLLEIKKNIDLAYPISKPIEFFFFDPMLARGCTGHPNVEDHQIIAEHLIPFFKKLLSS